MFCVVFCVVFWFIFFYSFLFVPFLSTITHFSLQEIIGKLRNNQGQALDEHLVRIVKTTSVKETCELSTTLKCPKTLRKTGYDF